MGVLLLPLILFHCHNELQTHIICKWVYTDARGLSPSSPQMHLPSSFVVSLMTGLCYCYTLQVFVCHPGGQARKSRPRTDMGMSRLRRGSLRFGGEVCGEGSCCFRMEFIVLSGVTSEQFRGGWAERLDRREVGRWLEVGGFEFGFWRLDLWVLMHHLCWHCFCYCCCCRSCCWE